MVAGLIAKSVGAARSELPHVRPGVCPHPVMFENCARTAFDAARAGKGDSEHPASRRGAREPRAARPAPAFGTARKHGRSNLMALRHTRRGCAQLDECNWLQRTVSRAPVGPSEKIREGLFRSLKPLSYKRASLPSPARSRSLSLSQRRRVVASQGAASQSARLRWHSAIHAPAFSHPEPRMPQTPKKDEFRPTQCAGPKEAICKRRQHK